MAILCEKIPLDSVRILTKRSENFVPLYTMNHSSIIIPSCLFPVTGVITFQQAQDLIISAGFSRTYFIQALIAILYSWVVLTVVVWLPFWLLMWVILSCFRPLISWMLSEVFLYTEFSLCINHGTLPPSLMLMTWASTYLSNVSLSPHCLNIWSLSDCFSWILRSFSDRENFGLCIACHIGFNLLWLK